MNWFKKWVVKLALNQVDAELTPLIAAKVKQAQATLNSIPADEFAKQLVSDIEDEVLKYFGLTKEDVK